MQLRRAFPHFARFLVVASAVTWISVGCSRQGEGERCDAQYGGNSDCDDGLICRRCETIRDSTVDRCCRENGSFDDARCEPGTNVQGLCDSDVGGRGGTSSMGSSGEGGVDANLGGTGGTAGTDSSAGGTDASSGGTDSSAGGTEMSGAGGA